MGSILWTAFDQVDHGMISHKQQNLDIVGKLGEWLHDFVKLRIQVVTAKYTLSEKTHILSGKPKETVLIPLFS